MSTKPLLEVRGVSKKFCRNLQQSFRLGLEDLGYQALGLRRQKTQPLRPNEFWAVKDATFSMGRGEAIAILGANGEGKTTLLKMIGGIIKPDQGEIVVRGTVAPVFAKGVGFHKLLSCRENIFLNLSLLGRKQSEISKCLDSIIDFAELSDDLVDAPLKTYSSGLMARLSFACAVEARADLLLVDETLAVGDMRFRAKCYRKMSTLREGGTSLILVSHSIGVLNNNTARALYMRGGKIILDGDTSTVTTRYEDDQLFNPYIGKLTAISSSEILFSGADGKKRTSASSGETLRLEFPFLGDKAVQRLTVTFEEIPRGLGIVLQNSWNFESRNPGDTLVEYPQLGLVGGVYLVHVNAQFKDGSETKMTTSLKVKSPSEISQMVLVQPVTWGMGLPTQEPRNASLQSRPDSIQETL